MNKIKKLTIDNETVYVNRGVFGWSVVHPIKNDDGSWNLKNLFYGGSIYKLLFVIFLVALIIGVVNEYGNSLEYCAKLISNMTHVEEIIKSPLWIR